MKLSDDQKAIYQPDARRVKLRGELRLNGKELGALWTSPWSVDISAAAKAGSNSLEIAVVNGWNNRLVGDASLPTERRLTSLTAQTVKPDAPLQSAGLLGPVTVQLTDGKN